MVSFFCNLNENNPRTKLNDVASTINEII